MEQLTIDCDALKKDYDDLQAQYQLCSTLNEELKNTNHSIIKEKQASIDQLSQQIDGMQHIHVELVEKQAVNERQRQEQKIEFDRFLQDTIDQYETKMKLLQSRQLFVDDVRSRSILLLFTF
jgi:hypothetical protein